MSHTRVKTTYEIEGPYASTKIETLFCHHNHSSDYTTFYDESGDPVEMHFEQWTSDNNLWDAMNRLWSPFEKKWHGPFIDGVEYMTPEDSAKCKI